MFNLPDSAFIDKVVPKNRFNIKNIQKIVWLYNLSQKTINIPPTDEIKEIQIFKTVLLSDEIPKKDLKAIQSKIPYPILFVLEYQDKIFYAIFDKEQFYCEEKKEFNFLANDMKELYQNIIKTFFVVDGDFEVSKEIDLKIRKIEKEMKSLQSKIAKEKQFKYKVELNKKLLSLKKELEELKSE